MIFAPRSWPSRPAFAITTLIFRATERQYRNVRLTVIGSSPAWPNPCSAQSGYLVEGAGALLLDCGPGVLARLRQRERRWPPVDAIAITHLHLDHVADLVGWQWAQLMGPGRGSPPVSLWAPPGSRAELDSLLHHGAEAFDLREYRPGEPFQAAGFRVSAHPVRHYDRGAFGFRVEDGERVLAYTGDTAPTPTLADLARDADLFLCEATLATAEKEPRGHLTAAEARELAAASGARRTLLTHRPVELARPDGVEVARDGLELDV